MDINEIDSLKEDIFATRLLLNITISILSKNIGIDIKKVVHEAVDDYYSQNGIEHDEISERIKNKIKEI
ncbi:hypothetical protein [Serratia sp. TMDUHS_CL]|uniref:hypothetical protein n=1 Tax=Serratia sp. TMDUHS_CL TaxID=3128862 RepID=UPI003016989F